MSRGGMSPGIIPGEESTAWGISEVALERPKELEAPPIAPRQRDVASNAPRQLEAGHNALRNRADMRGVGLSSGPRGDMSPGIIPGVKGIRYP